MTVRTNFRNTNFFSSLTSTHKFEGAEGNLKQILDKNQSTSNNDSKKMIGNLMNLIKELLYDESTKNLSNVSFWRINLPKSFLQKTQIFHLVIFVKNEYLTCFSN